MNNNQVPLEDSFFYCATITITASASTSHTHSAIHWNGHGVPTFRDNTVLLLLHGTVVHSAIQMPPI